MVRRSNAADGPDRRPTLKIFLTEDTSMRLASFLRVTLSFALGAGSAVVVVKLRGRSTAGPPVAPEAVEAPSAPQAWPKLSAPFVPTGARCDDGEDAEFVSRARASGAPTLDPIFAARMVPKLSQAMGSLVLNRRGELLEVRCQARICVARVRLPPEVQAQ